MDTGPDLAASDLPKRFCVASGQRKEIYRCSSEIPFPVPAADVESPSLLPAALQDNSSAVRDGAVQGFPAGCSGGPSRAAASARDVPEGFCSFSIPWLWMWGWMRPLLSLRGGTVTALDQSHSPRPDVICENPHFPLPGVLVSTCRDEEFHRAPEGS